MSMTAESIMPQANLQQLLRGIAAAPPLAIGNIASDSRQLGQGDVFFALQGAATHGLDHAAAAVAAGAAAIVYDRDAGGAHALPESVLLVPVSGLAGHIGEIANRWFGFPSGKLFVTGITGTNGKTTVAFLLSQCLNRLGRNAAYIGTLGSGSGSGELLQGGGLTTPACIDLHRLLAEFLEAGATQVALEVSSHGLQQDRVAGVEFDAAIFTNLSRDHIDYHGDMQSYAETKARLFLEQELQHRIINVDDPFGRELAARCEHNVVMVSGESVAPVAGQTFLSARRAPAGPDGARISVSGSWGNAEFELPLAGSFNVQNAASVLALLLCREVPLAAACEFLATAEAPPGRLQQVAAAAGPRVYVDYAHTPAALEAALRALRPHVKGRLWCVFGCGGDRDQGKRPMMGKTAARLADCPIVTSDNPRSEPPENIIADTLSGMPDDSIAIADRAAAISYAITHAGDDDLLLIAGKGHETYQQTGDRRTPFSDYQVAAGVLGKKAASSADRS